MKKVMSLAFTLTMLASTYGYAAPDQSPMTAVPSQGAATMNPLVQESSTLSPQGEVTPKTPLQEQAQESPLEQVKPSNPLPVSEGKAAEPPKENAVGKLFGTFHQQKEHEKEVVTTKQTPKTSKVKVESQTQVETQAH